MSTELVISFEVDGIHFWPDAPKQYEEFSHPHRHLFKFVCWWETVNFTNDPKRRDKELWELRQETIQTIFNYFLTKVPEGDLTDTLIRPFAPLNFEDMSCEGIADTVKELGHFSKVFVGEEFWLGAMVS